MMMSLTHAQGMINYIHIHTHQRFTYHTHPLVPLRGLSLNLVIIKTK